MTSNNEPMAIMASYFDCWRKGDLATLRTILADDFSFRGPLGQVDNAEDGVQAMRGLAQMTTDIVVRKVFADGPDVLTWLAAHQGRAAVPGGQLEPRRRRQDRPDPGYVRPEAASRRLDVRSGG
jgi:ketosteroid isomerase-like protein